MLAPTVGHTKSLQVFNTPQSRLPVRNGRIKIVLLALVINAEPLKSKIASRPIVRLNRPRQENGTLHPQILHPVLHHRQLQSNHASNLNRATERNFPVALGEVQITDTELRPLDMDR